MRKSLSWGRLAAAGLAVALTVSAAACGSDKDAGGTTPNTAAGFPVTVAGVYGAVTVPAKPSRVVALNVQVAEILVSLGVQPVAVATSDKQISESFPWLAGVFTGKLDPELLENYEANPEKIANYRPDLIAASSFNLPEKAYPQAKDVAPTFAGIAAANDDWDDTARTLGKLVGADAQGVIDGVERACATARQKVPGLAGRTYQWVATGDGQFRFGNGTWLECFGLKPAANQDNTQSTNAAVSQERIEELNADVLAIWDFANEAQKVKTDPRFAKLPAATTGAVIWTDLPLASATNSAAPKSYDYLIQRVLPILEASPASR